MATERAALHGRRVLVLDGDVETLSLLTDLLAEAGAEVEATSSAPEAMAALQVHDLDLILLDLEMPQPDGWDVLSFMRSVRPALVERALLLAEGSDNRRGLPRQWQGIPIICKPPSPQRVREAAVARLTGASFPEHREAPRAM